jgi:3-hydroxy acid dehydrogenase/malonic semialdehyde reductase
MTSLQGRTVLVTGASSGIGEACARAFAARGARVLLAARRRERLDSLRAELEKSGALAHAFTLDVRDKDAVAALERELAERGLLPDILVNNAGLSRGLEPLWEGELDDWDEMIDTNVKGLLYVTRAFLPHMVASNRGDVVNIGSQAGHMVYPKGNVYAASKFAVKAITHGGNVDLVGTRVRMSTVDPGMTHTEFSEVRFHGDKERSDAFYRGYTPLTGADIAEAVVWVVERPPHVHVRDVVMMPIVQRNMMVFEDRKK